MPDFFAGPNEQRQDQLSRVQSRFADQPAQRGRLPQSAQTKMRKLASTMQIHDPRLRVTYFLRQQGISYGVVFESLSRIATEGSDDRFVSLAFPKSLVKLAM